MDPVCYMCAKFLRFAFFTKTIKLPTRQSAVMTSEVRMEGGALVSYIKLEAITPITCKNSKII